jgi:nicotinamide-nucleotide amidase
MTLSSLPATAEIISIGDEMTSGARLDTNSQWLSASLHQIGVRTRFHTTAGDAMDDLCSVIQIAASRASLVVITGGLGPTQDDLTRQAISLVAGVPLEFRQEAMDHIERLFARRHRPMPDSNRIQAMFPAGSSIIPNPHGTAPGIDLVLTAPFSSAEPASGADIRHAQPCRIFALPGVPAELQEMWHQTVRPTILAALKIKRSFASAIIKCFGLGESEMESHLGNMIARDHIPRVGITVNRATISLRIEAEGDSPAEAERWVQTARATIEQRVGKFIFGEGESFELEHAVVAQLRRLQQTLYVVELGHACCIIPWLAATEATDVFQGGQFLLPSQPVEHGHSTLAIGTVSNKAAPDTCDYNEDGPAPMLWPKADWILTVDHYPTLRGAEQGPLPASTVRFSLVTPDASRITSEETLSGHPEVIQPRIGKAALFFLYQHLCSLKR